MGPITLMANTFGARIFDEEWNSEWNSPAWNAAVSFYVDLVNSYGPPGVVNNGFNENLALFNEGHCTMWIDATVAAGFVSDPRQSKVAETVAFAPAPTGVTDKGAQWLWAWSLAIPTSSQNVDAAKKFIYWATSKDYQHLVAEQVGWGNVPPGTRTSLYETQEYLNAAPFAEQTLMSMNAADPIDSTLLSKPYIGISFAIIPEYQGIGTFVGQQIAGAVAGSSTVAEALAAAAANADREMEQAGYK
jgi:sorbitol/mannitol transport system substrate-binding protein